MILNPKYFIENTKKEYLSKVCLGEEPEYKVVIRLSAESVSSVGDYRLEAKVRIAKDVYWTFLTTCEELDNNIETFLMELREIVKILGPEHEQITVTVRRFVPREGRRLFHDAIINEYAFFPEDDLFRKYLPKGSLPICEHENIYLIPLSFKYYKLNKDEMILLNPTVFDPYTSVSPKILKQNFKNFHGWYGGYELDSIVLLLCHQK